MLLHLRANGIGHLFQREVLFHPQRKWRFDFASHRHKLAVEVEGGTWGKSRHTTGTGFEADCEKYCEAACLGWRVLRFTSGMVTSGKAVEYIKRALGETGK